MTKPGPNEPDDNSWAVKIGLLEKKPFELPSRAELQAREQKKTEEDAAVFRALDAIISNVGLPARLRAAALEVDEGSDDFAALICTAGMYMTDAELSSACTVSQSTVQRWKRGGCEPHWRIKPLIYRLIAEALESRGPT